MTDKKQTPTAEVPASVVKLVNIFEEVSEENKEPFPYKDKLITNFTEYYSDPECAKALDEAVKAAEGLKGEKASDAVTDVITSYGATSPVTIKYFEKLFASVYS